MDILYAPEINPEKVEKLWQIHGSACSAAQTPIFESVPWINKEEKPPTQHSTFEENHASAGHPTILKTKSPKEKLAKLRKRMATRVLGGRGRDMWLMCVQGASYAIWKGSSIVVVTTWSHVAVFRRVKSKNIPPPTSTSSSNAPKSNKPPFPGKQVFRLIFCENTTNRKGIPNTPRASFWPLFLLPYLARKAIEWDKFAPLECENAEKTFQKVLGGKKRQNNDGNDENDGSMDEANTQVGGVWQLSQAGEPQNYRKETGNSQRESFSMDSSTSDGLYRELLGEADKAKKDYFEGLKREPKSQDIWHKLLCDKDITTLKKLNENYVNRLEGVIKEQNIPLVAVLGVVAGALWDIGGDEETGLTPEQMKEKSNLAVEVYLERTKMAPKDWEVIADYAGSLCDEGEYKESISEYEKAVKLSNEKFKLRLNEPGSSPLDMERFKKMVPPKGKLFDGTRQDLIEALGDLFNDYGKLSLSLNCFLSFFRFGHLKKRLFFQGFE